MGQDMLYFVQAFLYAKIQQGVAKVADLKRVNEFQVNQFATLSLNEIHFLLLDSATMRHRAKPQTVFTSNINIYMCYL